MHNIGDIIFLVVVGALVTAPLWMEHTQLAGAGFL